MGSAATSIGMAGLTANTGKRESARLDLETMGKMVQMKEADEAKEQQAALMEQQYYDRIRGEADKLLDGDRRAINEKAKSVQAEIRNNIRLFGGSRQKFMANGGMALIGDYSNQILDSPELQTYRKNKENLTRILDLKEKNMGHLLTPQDQMALEAYERDGRGTITYSGVMNEIEIPKSDLFDYGYQMTPMDIYLTGSNKMKLTANWMLENPDKGEPSQAQILAYAQAKGYGGRGSNENALKIKAQAQSAAATKDETLHTFSTSLFAGLAPQNVVSIDKVGTDEAFTFDEFLVNMIGKRNWENKRSQTDPTIFNSLANVVPWGEGDHGYQLRGAKQMPTGLEASLFKVQNAENYIIEGNIVKEFDPMNTAAGMVFNGAGDLLDGRDLTWSTETSYAKGDYELMGTAVAFESVMKGKKTLVMDAVDESGKKDEDRTSSLYKTETGEKTPEARPVMVNMLRRKDKFGYDEYVYQKIDYDTQYKQAKLAEALGKVNELTDITKEGVQKAGDMQGMLSEEQLKQASKPNLPAQHNAFNQPLFEEQMKAYSPSGTLRSNVARSFYLAYQDLRGENFDMNSSLGGNDFNKMIEMLELQKHVKNPNYNDSEIISYFNQQMKTRATNKQEIYNADLITMKMQNYLDLINSPKK